MKVIVCGGRDYDDRETLFRALDALHARKPVTLLIEGGARGADAMALDWAHDRKIPSRQFVADWRKDGPAAGPIRNKRMLDEGKPDLVVAFPGGRGTDNMITQALVAGVDVYEVIGGALRKR